MNTKKYAAAVFSLLFLFAGFGFAFGDTAGVLSLNLQGAYSLGNQEGWGLSGDGAFAPISYSVIDTTSANHRAEDPGRSLGTTWGGAEAKAVVSYSLKYPFLTGDGALFKTNSVEYKFSGEISPVSVNALASVTLTPIALLKLSAGAGAGTGWYAGFNGLGRNLPGHTYDAPLKEPVSGIVYRMWMSATIQFDVGAVVPGKWNHIVVAAVPKLEYKGFTVVDNSTAWQWEADDGENFNGFKFYGTYVLGYQLPFAVNTVAFLLDTEQYVGHTASLSTMASGGWGSDFIKMNFGPLVSITLSNNSDLTVLFQLKNGRRYTDATIENRYFEYRKYESWYISLYRLALSYTIKF